MLPDSTHIILRLLLNPKEHFRIKLFLVKMPPPPLALSLYAKSQMYYSPCQVHPLYAQHDHYCTIALLQASWGHWRQFAQLLLLFASQTFCHTLFSMNTR